MKSQRYQEALRDWFTIDKVVSFNSHIANVEAPVIEAEGERCNFFRVSCTEIVCKGSAYVNHSTVEKVNVIGNLILINCPNVKEAYATGSIFTTNCPKLFKIHAEKNLTCEVAINASIHLVSGGTIEFIVSPLVVEFRFLDGIINGNLDLSATRVQKIVVGEKFFAKNIIFKQDDPENNIIEVKGDKPFAIPVINGNIIYSNK